MSSSTTPRETWSSKIGFIIAISGSAIGLGNIWKFPYMTGKYGGGAFLFTYLLSILLVGMPILLCELAIGRHTGKNPVAAFHAIGLEQKNRFGLYLGWLMTACSICFLFNHIYGIGILIAIGAFLSFKYRFAFVGAMSLFCSVIILSYYSVIGGWIFKYLGLFITGTIVSSNVAEANTTFTNFITSTWQVVLMHLLFMFLIATLLWSGIRNGIEKWSKILMPLMLFLLIAVIIRSVTLEGASKGLRFFLYPDFSKLTIHAVLDALGQSFFSLSLGMAICVTYGSYLHKNDNMFSSVFWVVIADTIAAILAGLAIFPAVFAMGFSPDAGPSLVFKVLPATFLSIPGITGIICGTMFFFALLIAAITSGAALFECSVTFLIDQWKFTRKKAIILCYIVISSLGILSAVSITDWSNIPTIHTFLGNLFGEQFIQGNFFDTLDILSTNWLLPMIGLSTVLFVGWFWQSTKVTKELRSGAENYCDNNIFLKITGLYNDNVYKESQHSGITLMSIFFLLVRYVTPCLLIFVFLKIAKIL
ncbi:MAG: sodium-dependent transporter [Lentisphaeria bacterium]